MWHEWHSPHRLYHLWQTLISALTTQSCKIAKEEKVNVLYLTGDSGCTSDRQYLPSNLMKNKQLLKRWRMAKIEKSYCFMLHVFYQVNTINCSFSILLLAPLIYFVFLVCFLSALTVVKHQSTTKQLSINVNAPLYMVYYKTYNL